MGAVQSVSVDLSAFHTPLGNVIALSLYLCHSKPFYHFDSPPDMRHVNVYGARFRAPELLFDPSLIGEYQNYFLLQIGYIYSMTNHPEC